jgi:hypothetical protein
MALCKHGRRRYFSTLVLEIMMLIFRLQKRNFLREGSESETEELLYMEQFLASLQPI